DRLVHTLRSRLGAAGPRGSRGTDLPTGRLGPLEEDDRGFSVTAILATGEGWIRTARVVWPKQPFEEWWREERGSIPITPPATSGAYSLELPASTACTNDTWRPTNFRPEEREGQAAVWSGSEMI